MQFNPAPIRLSERLDIGQVREARKAIRGNIGILGGVVCRESPDGWYVGRRREYSSAWLLFVFLFAEVKLASVGLMTAFCAVLPLTLICCWWVISGWMTRNRRLMEVTGGEAILDFGNTRIPVSEIISVSVIEVTSIWEDGGKEAIFLRLKNNRLVRLAGSQGGPLSGAVACAMKISRRLGVGFEYYSVKDSE